MNNSILDSFCQSIAKKSLNLYGIVVLQHGNLLAEHRWRDMERVHLHSMSKSFTSAAVGIAAGEGFLSIDDRVAGYFAEKLPDNPQPWLLQMTIRDLLMMASGHGKGYMYSDFESWKVSDLAKNYLSMPLDYKPGTHFVYSGGSAYLLSAIIQKVTGLKLRDYLRVKLFNPLGILNVQWHECPLGFSLGNSGLYLNTEEVSRYGQLLLQNGCWKDRQIIPSEWVKAATSWQIATTGEKEAGAGYGYQFWRSRWPGAYRGDGKYGQYCIVMPNEDAVVAITAHEEKSPHAILESVWSEIGPVLEANL